MHWRALRRGVPQPGWSRWGKGEVLFVQAGQQVRGNILQIFPLHENYVFFFSFNFLTFKWHSCKKLLSSKIIGKKRHFHKISFFVFKKNSCIGASPSLSLAVTSASRGGSGAGTSASVHARWGVLVVAFETLHVKNYMQDLKKNCHFSHICVSEVHENWQGREGQNEGITAVIFISFPLPPCLFR